MYIRSHDAIPGGEGTFMLSSWTTSTVQPIGISRDKTIFYGGDSGTLKQSTDEGITWTTVNSSAFPATATLAGLFELDDGEAVVFANPPGVPGRVYRSTGWSTSHTTATWSLVLTATGGGAASYGVNSATFGDNKITAGTGQYGVLACYGAQTPSSGDATTSGRYVYFTSDYGATWNLVFDLYTWSGNAAGMHVHGAAYDPYWDRLWIVWGDNQQNGKPDVVYSDDHGSTWVQINAMPSEWATFGALQSTTVLPLENYILFGSDPTQGLWMLPRKGYRTLGTQPTMVYMNSGGTSNTSISTHLTSVRGVVGGPIFHAWSTERADMMAGFSVSQDGVSFQRVWDYPQPSLRKINMLLGPSVKGTLLAGGQLNTTYYLITGRLIKPESDSIILKLEATGDGTTTAFTVPHYQGRTPASATAFAQSSAALASNTVTTDTTNVTITFAAAPANGAIVQMTVRLRP